jgi:hypothetical protein
VPFMSQQAFTGYIAARYLQGADISYYVGFLVAGALYLILARPRTAGVSPPERVARGTRADRPGVAGSAPVDRAVTASRLPARRGLASGRYQPLE